MDRKRSKIDFQEVRTLVAEGKEVNLAPGITARGSGFRLDFYFQGKRCRETLRLSLTATNLRKASDTLAAVTREIQLTGSFSYSQFFPAGKNANKYVDSDSQITIQELLEKWLERKSDELAHSTLDDYKKIINNVLIPEFGNTPLCNLTTKQVQEWIYSRTSSVKRTRNVLAPLHAIMTEAYNQELINRHPTMHLSFPKKKNNQKLNPDDDINDEEFNEIRANPFTVKDMQKILEAAKTEPQYYNLLKLAFWTGMRTSELIALLWKYVDLEKNILKVRLAYVRGQYKRPKSNAGNRNIKLLPPAREALIAQLEHTKNQKVVFHDPRHDRPWTGDKALREVFWKPTLKKAGIPYRRQYQTRHTFCSMMLSAGENPMWVAEQAGHADWAMLRKVYGKWIPDFDSTAGNLALCYWDKEIKS